MRGLSLPIRNKLANLAPTLKDNKRMEHADFFTYLEDCIRSYENYPPATRYEEGYRAALRELQEDLCMASEERRATRRLH
jgi:hypothetical protein